VEDMEERMMMAMMQHCVPELTGWPALSEGLYIYVNVHLRGSDCRGGWDEEILVTPMLIYSFGEAGLDVDLCCAITHL